MHVFINISYDVTTVCHYWMSFHQQVKSITSQRLPNGLDLWQDVGEPQIYIHKFNYRVFIHSKVMQTSIPFPIDPRFTMFHCHIGPPGTWCWRLMCKCRSGQGTGCSSCFDGTSCFDRTGLGIDGRPRGDEFFLHHARSICDLEENKRRLLRMVSFPIQARWYSYQSWLVITWNAQLTMMFWKKGEDG